MLWFSCSFWQFKWFWKDRGGGGLAFGLRSTRQRGVAHYRANRAMPEMVLYRSGVPSVTGQFVAGAVAQHVAVDKKLKAGSFKGEGNHPLVVGMARASS